MKMDMDPSIIIDQPNNHNMFMLGTRTIYLCHMPMFHRQDHRYQLTLQARLDPASTAVFVKNKHEHPEGVYNLVNLDKFTLPDVATGTVTSYPASVYRAYVDNDVAEQIIDRATVTIERVIRYRALNEDIPRPEHLTYVLFGDGREAHLDHYLARDPDCQHLLTHPEVPTWLSPPQLQAGVEVSFIDKASTPILCTNPLTEDAYQVRFEGVPETRQTLRVGAGATVWYSTGNFLNKDDPCKPGGSGMPMGHRH